MKLIVGQGGETIKYIQKKSKCRLQVEKTEEMLEARAPREQTVLVREDHPQPHLSSHPRLRPSGTQRRPTSVRVRWAQVFWGTGAEIAAKKAAEEAKAMAARLSAKAAKEAAGRMLAGSGGCGPPRPLTRRAALANAAAQRARPFCWLSLCSAAFSVLTKAAFFAERERNSTLPRRRLPPPRLLRSPPSRRRSLSRLRRRASSCSGTSGRERGRRSSSTKCLTRRRRSARRSTRRRVWPAWPASWAARVSPAGRLRSRRRCAQPRDDPSPSPLRPLSPPASAPSQEKEKVRDRKEENRRLYHLRHSRDYDVLGVPLGSKKDVIKAAYRKLAVKWHPDKHPEGPARDEATKKFVEIQKARRGVLRRRSARGVGWGVGVGFVCMGMVARVRLCVLCVRRRRTTT